MRLGVLSFLTAVVLSPLAAPAAESPPRFAVTLQATIADRFSYEYTQRGGECVVTRSGFGRRALRLRSVRRTRIQVAPLGGGVAYRPSRLVVRQSGTRSGAFEEVRRCRAAPIERIADECEIASLTPRIRRVRFRRPSADRIAFAGGPRPATTVCGLSPRISVLGAWLDLARGSVDEDALLSGRSARIVVRGAATREAAVPEYSALNLRHGATVRWTLTFRRLS